jgi:adenine-specific DNA-methyltransferase
MNIIKDRKKFGKFYTSLHLANLLSEILFEEFFKNNSSNIISILDPSCGNGIFLSESINQLNKFTQKENRNLNVSLCGIDIDKKAVLETSLLLKTMTHNNSNISCYIEHSDTLIDNEVLSKKNSNIQKSFLNILENGGYDIILGNPPWVSLVGKHAQNIYSDKQIAYLLDRYPCDKYRPNLFEMFIWRSLELLKSGGFLAFIIPDRLFHNYQFSGLRKVLFTDCKFTHIISGVKFDNVKSDNLLFILQKVKPESDSRIKIKLLSETDFDSINQSYIFRNKKYRYIFIKSGIKKIIEKIETHNKVTRLSSLFDTGVGFIGVKKQISQERLSTKQLKIITGRDIDSNKIHNYKYFEFIQKNLLGGTTNRSKLSKKPKIVLRKTGNRFKSALEIKGHLPEQSLYYIISKRDSLPDLLLLNRILNSELMNFYYLNMAITNINTTPQLKKRDLDNLPVISSDDIFDLVPKSKEQSFSSLKSKFSALSEQDIFKIFNINTKEQLIIENFLKEK